ncbi:MAG: succinate dehydrogenase assembly factor 2 [Alphaproteobacteria bacterium]|nr:MAG: succinate dehydrogenase assembly factor 2 [Alphaproteobacteria bacterium]
MSDSPALSDLETRKKRLKYQCWHRGMKEVDLIFGNFADAHLAELDEAGISELEGLLQEPDQEIYEWLTGRTPVPAAYDTPLFARIQSLDYLAGTVLRKD